MNAIKYLHNTQQGYQALLSLWADIKSHLVAGHKLEMVVRPARRTTASSSRFHAICTDLEKARFSWMGHPRSKAEWKVLLISGHAVATKEGANVIPGIEGELVNIRESEALMSGPRSSSLVQYSEAFCIDNDVPLRDPESEQARAVEEQA